MIIKDEDKPFDFNIVGLSMQLLKAGYVFNVDGNKWEVTSLNGDEVQNEGFVIAEIKKHIGKPFTPDPVTAKDRRAQLYIYEGEVFAVAGDIKIKLVTE